MRHRLNPVGLGEAAQRTVARLDDREEMIPRGARRRRGTESVEADQRLGQRLAGPAGFRDHQERGAGEVPPAQQFVHLRRVEVVAERHPRAGHPPLGQRQQRPAAEAGAAGRKHDYVGELRPKTRRQWFQRRQIVAPGRQRPMRHRRRRVVRAQPVERSGQARQRRRQFRHGLFAADEALRKYLADVTGKGHAHMRLHTTPPRRPPPARVQSGLALGRESRSYWP